MAAWSRSPIETRYRVINGLSIRFAESADGARGGTDRALLLSPWPESLFAFEPVWNRLAVIAHLIAVDLPGFGHSQRDNGLMAPRAMGEFVVRVADAFELEQPHVVGPDIGTAASLFAAADNPGRFRSLVVDSGGAASAAVPSTFERYEPSDYVREDYLSAYEGDRLAQTMRYARAHQTEWPSLRKVLHRIDTPVQIIAGAQDTAVSRRDAKLLHEWLPNSALHIVDAGHFTWEDAADDYAALVASWWTVGHATVVDER